MSFALSKAATLKAEIRLAQAVSQFEADLSSDQKADFRSQRSRARNAPPSAQDVMCLTAKIDQETSRKGGGGGRCFGPRFTNVLQAVQQFAAMGDVIIGGSQNIIACGVWTLVRMTLLALVNHSSYIERLSTLLMIAGRSAPRYQKLALLYAQSRILQANLSEYFIVVVQLCHHMLKTIKRTLIGQLVSSLSDSELKDYETGLLRWATAIKEEADLLLKENINNQGARVKSLLKLSESEAYRQKLRIHCQLLDSCSTYDYEATWKEIRKAGNVALLNSTPEYEKWKSEVKSSTLLWRGKLGAGKSVVLANVVDDLNLHVSGSQCPVAYFFCRHDTIESLTARTVLGSLARQLLRSLPLRETQHLVDETMPNLDCERILSALRQTIPSSFRAFFVLDGLDECGEKERLSLLDHVRTIQNMFGLLVCLSFRVDASSTQWLIPSMIMNPHLVTIPDDNPDIASFINSRLESSIMNGRLKVGNPAIIAEIEQALLQGSQGMFLWVALQIESLCNSKTDHAIRNTLANLPKDLPETFTRIIQKSGEAGKDYQMRVFQIVVAAFRPLTVDELQEALSVFPGNTNWNPAHSLNDIYSALACCGSLVSINEEALTVKLVHHSVKQYLLDGAAPLDAGLLTLDSAHRAIGEIIITYLSYGIFDTTLSRVVAPSIKPEASPFKIVKALDAIGPVQTLALKYLQSRRQSGYNMGKTLVELATKHQASSTDVFHFRSYAESNWLNHVMFIPLTEQATTDLVLKLIMSQPSSDYTGHFSNGDRCLLSWAAELGYEEVVRALLERGVDIEVRDSSGMTPLCLAVSQGHQNVVDVLISKGANLECRISLGMNPLFLAVQSRNLTIATLLLSRGASPDVSSGYANVYCMILGRLKDSTGIRKPLLEFLEAEFRSPGGINYRFDTTALTLAISTGDEAMVQLLLNHDVRLGHRRDVDYWNSLEFAVLSGHTRIVERILYHRRLSAGSSISIAVRNHDVAMVKTLLECLPDSKESCSSSLYDMEGYAPLQLAVLERQQDIVSLLLKHGADPNTPHVETGRTPLMEAVRIADRKLTQLLVVCGADLSLRDREGRTVLSWAAEGGDPVIIDYLVTSERFDRSEYGLYDNANRTPLFHAILCRKVLAAKKLLELGASPNIKDGHCTALGLAASDGLSSVVELLLEHGADPNPGFGPSPLDQAIISGCFESVRLLVQYGSVGRAYGGVTGTITSESEFARALGQPEIAQYLEEKGL